MARAVTTTDMQSYTCQIYLLITIPDALPCRFTRNSLPNGGTCKPPSRAASSTGYIGKAKPFHLKESMQIVCSEQSLPPQCHQGQY